jgi:hypothetical protein
MKHNFLLSIDSKDEFKRTGDIAGAISTYVRIKRIMVKVLSEGMNPFANPNSAAGRNTISNLVSDSNPC